MNGPRPLIGLVHLLELAYQVCEMTSDSTLRSFVAPYVTSPTYGMMLAQYQIGSQDPEASTLDGSAYTIAISKTHLICPKGSIGTCECK